MLWTASIILRRRANITIVRWKKARRKIVAYVESYDDVFFWRSVLGKFENEVNAAVRTLTLKLAEARLLGDVDNDGAVTTADSTALLAASAELTELDADAAAAADVNGDGVADTGDAALILEYAAEKVAGF